ncbi:MAG: tRNA pseudouridine(55) synthase TruB [Limnothrix sp. RL_2_0]|nr:tRNA pseudouridine(55) synthase TruB [Limnothrix sp. RL_2_0]
MDGDRQKFEGWGFINLHKPLGWTSHDCVGRLRRLLRLKKIGHGGTLDPLATGVLPIAVGKATRLLQYLPKMKTYRGTIRFGVQTTTDDLAGEAIATQPCPTLTEAQVSRYLPEFIGHITQIPPAFSAIQRDGKRLYELARQGIEVDVPSREVDVYDLKVLAWRDGEFPELELEIHCGEGTYIRAIARDLGTKLGTGGTLAGLVRTSSGGFHLDQSLTLEHIEAQLDQSQFHCQLPNQVLQHLPKIILAEAEELSWNYGKKLPWIEVTEPLGTAISVYNQDDLCLGVGEFHLSKDDETQTVLAPRLVLQGH